MALSNAERQAAHRRRQAARAVIYPIFGEQDALTIGEFLPIADGFDRAEFLAALEDLGEETAEHEEERIEIWTDARDEAWQESYEDARILAYEEALAVARANGENLTEIQDELQRQAHEEAVEVADSDIDVSEAANDAVEEWRRGLDDYENERVIYDIADLLEAFRAAHPLLND